MDKKLTLKDEVSLVRNSSEISRMCIKKGYAIVRMPSGRCFKIRELG